MNAAEPEKAIYSSAKHPIGSKCGKPSPMFWANLSRPCNTPLFWAKLTNALPPDLLEVASHDWHFDSEKARADLGWQPLSWHDGLVETWGEYQAIGVGTPPQSPVRAMRRA